jgi:uncharacterized membrane protein YphA (DoxX/SURF4 family)
MRERSFSLERCALQIAAAVLSVVAALVFLLAGGQKVLMWPRVATNLRRLGVGPALTRVIGISEIAGAVGLIAGIWMAPVGIAAAAGLICLLIGAVVYHGRAGDFSNRERRTEALAPGALLIVAGTIGALLLSAP